MPLLGGGTDWQSLVFNDNAPVMKHDVAISGANDIVNYYTSVGYFTQDGIVGGNYGHSNYDRLTIRNNNIYTLLDTKERNFLHKITATSNIAYTYINNSGVSENSEYGSILGSALYMSPILTPTVTGAFAQQMIDHYPGYELLRDANGEVYTIPGYNGTYQEMNNPLAMLSLPAAKNWSHKFVCNFALEINLWDNLRFHTSFSPDLSFWGSDSHTGSKYLLSGNNFADHTSVSASANKGLNWQWENYLAYDKTFGKHTVSVVAGTSAFRAKSDWVGASHWNLVNPEKPYLNYTDGVSIEDGVMHLNGWGGVNAEHRVASTFARASYNYDERYMVQATVRRDGSSNFGTSHRFGVFPSFSLGWNIMNERFMADTRDWLSNLKARVSWGKNGSDRLPAFSYTTMTTMGNNVLFGKDAVINGGSKADGLANPDLRWEESEQIDAGLDFGFFNNMLTFTVDYFQKNTNGMIMTMPVPSYVGESKPQGNVGDMKNQGVELELGFKKTIGDLRIAVKANASYLKNELVNLGNDTGYVEYDGVQGISGGSFSRGENGLPFPFFYGYKTAGVYQTEADAAAGITYKGAKPRPGDVIFVDVDGNGDIDANDRTMIGKGTPDWNFGFNFNLDWKGLDFNLFLQGVAGAQVADATYRFDVFSGNYPNWMLGRWTGPGTSDKYPILKAGDEKNWQFSDLFIYNGSYLRVKNVSLGYTLPQKITKKAFIDRFRVYAMAENLFTFTKYHGFDPEISSNGKSCGIDRGIYPQARTFTVGLQVAFAGSHAVAGAADAANSYNPRVVEKIVEKVVEKPVEVVKEVVKEVPVQGAAQPAARGSFDGKETLNYIICKTDLQPDEAFKLGRICEMLKENPNTKVEIAAYADRGTGNDEINTRLAKERADVVKAKLVAEGISANRISITSAIGPERITVCVVK